MIIRTREYLVPKPPPEAGNSSRKHLDTGRFSFLQGLWVGSTELCGRFCASYDQVHVHTHRDNQGNLESGLRRILSLGRQRQLNLYEFWVTLVYTEFQVSEGYIVRP